MKTSAYRTISENASFATVKSPYLNYGLMRIAAKFNLILAIIKTGSLFWRGVCRE